MTLAADAPPAAERLAPSRLDSLDVIRGVAVLGILLMNIVDFAMPVAAYFNPRAYGGWHGANHAAWLVNYLLFDGKMRGLFSLLFGASMLIVAEAAEASGRDPAKVHYARMGWLFAFGLAHLWLLWDGDILSLYAPIGMLAFAFRKLPVHRLVVIAALMIAAETVLTGSVAIQLYATERAAALDPSTETLAQLADYATTFGVPAPAHIANELAVARGGYPGHTLARLQEYSEGPLPAILFVGLETLGYMLLGMALLRSGLLAGRWSRARYARWAAIGLGVGLAGYGAGALYLAREHHAMLATVIAQLAAPTPLRPVMIVGWACLILLLARPGGGLTARLAAVGRMAFTNYLMTSLICTTLFYGYGLGWFGQLQRAELYAVVALVWAAILVWSKPWLARFRYGPFEWLWRSLSRGALQPMRRAANASDPQ